MQSFVRRQSEIAVAGIREVVVFHSGREALLEHAAELPFPDIADPSREQYAEFAVESSLWARWIRGHGCPLSATWFAAQLWLGQQSRLRRQLFCPAGLNT